MGYRETNEIILPLKEPSDHEGKQAHSTLQCVINRVFTGYKEGRACSVADGREGLAMLSLVSDPGG